MQAVAQPPRSGGVVDEYRVDHANEKRSLGQVFGCYGTLHILALTQVFKQPKATRASAVSRKPINRYNTPDRPRAAA